MTYLEFFQLCCLLACAVVVTYMAAQQKRLRDRCRDLEARLRGTLRARADLQHLEVCRIKRPDGTEGFRCQLPNGDYMDSFFYTPGGSSVLDAEVIE